MKQTSRILGLRFGLAVAALFSALAFTSAGLSPAANAGPYHMDRLADGSVTGPLTPDAHGG
jgi:hypothetical protein